MNPISITVTENKGRSRQGAITEFSVPFADRAFRVDNKLNCENAAIAGVSHHVMSTWPSGYVKWLRCFIEHDIDANATLELQFFKQKGEKASKSLGQWQEDDGRRKSFLQDCFKASICHHVSSNPSGDTEIVEFVPQKSRTLAQFNQHSVGQTRYLATSIKQDFLQFELVETIYTKTLVRRFDLTIHNKNRAMHPNGQWDLGDENSIFLKSIDVHFPSTGQVSVLNLDNSATTIDKTQNVSIIQHSSGGDNWNSKVHVDRHNEVPFSIQGYQLEANGESSAGQRISPILCSENRSVYLENFWQNFPSSLVGTEDQLSVGLLPKVGYLHELLPGEKKTHSLWVGDNLEHVLHPASPTVVNVDKRHIEHTNVLPFFNNAINPQLQDIINLGLDDKNGFIAKRELIDEYGWRNFGDLYADHENAEFNSDELIISHYNNQYDPIYGFLNQFLKSGNSQWFELAEDLAKHVIDIDIYHTDLDKEEYNHGLFWHTDHYVDAKTAGHRTYSKNQPQNVYMDHAGGGGPGGQHCYTSGLTLYYWLTGNEQAKDAVLKLTEWMTCVYEGTGGLLDFALALKNKHRADLKNPVTGQYPLDRGTGNYIVSLLDAFDLSGKQSYLDRASLVIKRTVSLDEDLTQRGFENVEETWFYTVFLQAVARYIFVKTGAQQQDESYEYAIKVMLKFSEWMSENEQPYLKTPEILEFPNQTWTAQDLRKVGVLRIASFFSEDPKPLRDKAEEILQYVLEQLGQDKNADYCRILCLLMQNCDQVNEDNGRALFKPHQFGLKTDTMSKTYSLTEEMLSRLQSFKLKSEIKWLAKRSAKVNALLLRETRD